VFEASSSGRQRGGATATGVWARNTWVVRQHQPGVHPDQQPGHDRVRRGAGDDPVDVLQPVLQDRHTRQTAQPACHPPPGLAQLGADRQGSRCGHAMPVAHHQAPGRPHPAHPRTSLTQWLPDRLAAIELNIDLALLPVELRRFAPGLLHAMNHRHVPRQRHTLRQLREHSLTRAEPDPD
jgi:hypothetical protein